MIYFFPSEAFVLYLNNISQTCRAIKLLAAVRFVWLLYLPLTQTGSYLLLPCPIHFRQNQLNILIQKNETESHPETIFVTQKKKPKHTLLKASEGNGTLGTPFLHYELKPPVYQMTGEEKHVKINCLYTAREEYGVGLLSYKLKSCMKLENSGC